MGNCLRHESSSLQWAGEDWGSLASERSEKGLKMEEEEEGLLGGGGGDGGNYKLGFTSSSTTGTTEVKIKITKKQLEELLGKVDVKELSVQQVLVQLMNVSDRYESHHRSWRPALQSIPEVN
ncbi:hypothetical protein Patl1_04200 [Pistacia atlantica]|uniref:Uncharacterized protein n=1 Tax=Pistacia atlantica TaxID=434234 RepID=A0ACC1BU88_9ROSI|nr:hypothetical protein Patl1_04200 [Pistacia atlantica]